MTTMIFTRSIALSALVLVPAAAVAVPIAGPPLNGTRQVVNNGPGDQFDPHVSGPTVSYTEGSSSSYFTVRYHDLNTSTDAVIPRNGGSDILADVAGNTIVYTHLTDQGTSAIYAFDVSTNGPPAEIAPPATSTRRAPNIGGSTIAWEEYPIGANNPQIVAYDRTTRTTTAVTSGSPGNFTPAVSPAGNVIAWTQCSDPLAATGCHIWDTVFVNGVSTPKALTATSAGEEANPDTNGTTVVYESTRAGSQDIFWQPAGGGSEQRLGLSGPSRNPHISGNLISFEHFNASAPVANYDIYVYDLSSNTLYQVTNTQQDENLNDISVDASGKVRIAWSVPEADLNVYASTFQLPSSCTANSAPGCVRPLLAQLQLKTPAVPNSAFATKSFAAVPTTDGLLCVQDGVGGSAATSGFATVNFQVGVTPLDFATATTPTILKRIDLGSTNWLLSGIDGQPGTAFSVSVYGADPCTQGGPAGFGVSAGGGSGSIGD